MPVSAHPYYAQTSAKLTLTSGHPLLYSSSLRSHYCSASAPPPRSLIVWSARSPRTICAQEFISPWPLYNGLASSSMPQASSPQQLCLHLPHFSTHLLGLRAKVLSGAKRWVGRALRRWSYNRWSEMGIREWKMANNGNRMGSQKRMDARWESWGHFASRSETRKACWFFQERR